LPLARVGVAVEASWFTSLLTSVAAGKFSLSRT
jgi:hypothetical protein